jgi:hypothetical protein
LRTFLFIFCICIISEASKTKLRAHFTKNNESVNNSSLPIIILNQKIKLNEFDFFSVMKSIEENFTSERDSKPFKNVTLNTDLNRPELSYLNVSFKQINEKHSRKHRKENETISFKETTLVNKTLTKSNEIEETHQSEEAFTNRTSLGEDESSLNTTETDDVTKTLNEISEENPNDKHEPIFFFEEKPKQNSTTEGITKPDGENTDNPEEVGFENVQFVKAISPYSQSFLNDLTQNPTRRDRFLIDRISNYFENNKVYSSPAIMTDVIPSQITGVITVQDEMLWPKVKKDVSDAFDRYQERPLVVGVREILNKKKKSPFIFIHV